MGSTFIGISLNKIGSVFFECEISRYPQEAREWSEWWMRILIIRMSERSNIGGRYFWGKVQIIFPPTLTLLLGAEVGVHGVALEQPGAVQRELDTVPTPAEKMIR